MRSAAAKPPPPRAALPAPPALNQQTSCPQLFGPAEAPTATSLTQSGHKRLAAAPAVTAAPLTVHVSGSGELALPERITQAIRSYLPFSVKLFIDSTTTVDWYAALALHRGEIK